MIIYLVDGTYELFRNHFGAPPKKAPDGREVGATLGLLRGLLALLARPETTYVACAFDHVIESFRNKLFPGYKTGAGVDPNLMAQSPLAEEAVSALGLVVWPMVEFEADDALAAAGIQLSVFGISHQDHYTVIFFAVNHPLVTLLSGHSQNPNRSETGM